MMTSRPLAASLPLNSGVGFTEEACPVLLLPLRRLHRVMLGVVTFYCLLNLAQLLAGQSTDPGTSFLSEVAYVIGDSCAWIVAAYVIFAAIDLRGWKPIPRVAAMLAGGTAIALTATALLSCNAALGWLLHIYPISFADLWARMLPMYFQMTVFYVALIVGIGYSIRSRAAEDYRRLAESRLAAAVARAHLESLALRLQPEIISTELSEIAALLDHGPSRAQARIASLGEHLRGSLYGPAASPTDANPQRRNADDPARPITESEGA